MANKKKNKTKSAKPENVKKTITKIPQQKASDLKESVQESDTKAAKKGKDEKKTSKKVAPSKKKKANVFVRAWEFIKSVVTELKKVSWLTGEELAKSTAVVAGMVAVMTLLVWLVDTGLGFMAAKLIGS